MPKLQCHICQSLKGLIVLRTGLSICPRCLYNFPLEDYPFHPVIRKHFVFTKVIDDRGTLDYIGAQLMANFIHNGMSVRSVARQMGITHSTIYRRLRKYDLLKTPDDGNLKLHVSPNDLNQSGF